MTGSLEGKDVPHIIVDDVPPAGLELDTESHGAANNSSTRQSLSNTTDEMSVAQHLERRYLIADPTNPAEKNRLNFQHLLFRATLSDELFSAPLKELEGGVHNVIDIGTGTGIWATDFARQFPSANVTGIDLSLAVPKDMPANCHFMVKDAETPWEFPHQFDYIHGRALAACFRSHFNVFKSAFAALRPGGYLELQDLVIPFHSLDDSFRGTMVEKWFQRMMDGGAALGSDWTRVIKYKQYLEEAGFEAIVETRYSWPLGTWAKGEKMKMLGELYRDDLMAMMDSFSMAVMTAGLKMKPKEIKELLADAKEEMWTNKIHIYIPMILIYGRKPL